MSHPVFRHFRDPYPALSHWFGALLGLGGLAALVLSAGSKPGAMVTAIVYGVSLVALFSASAYYHTALCDEATEEKLVRFDYTAIFLLIAGTYTPVCLLGMRGAWGWGIFAAEWTMALFGIISVFTLPKIPSIVRVLLFLTMGWMVLLALGPTIRGLTRPEITWLLTGGIIYSLGAVVYATRRPNLWPGRFIAHDLWHSMVVAGAGCHFMTVYSLVSAG